MTQYLTDLNQIAQAMANNPQLATLVKYRLTQGEISEVEYTEVETNNVCEALVENEKKE